MTRIALCFILALSSTAFADKPKIVEQLEGNVKGVIDGDTLTLHASGKVMSVRLEGIDAPESAQLYGPESRAALKQLVTGKDVIVQKTGVDTSGHVLGIVLVDKTNVNAKMVEDGWAWHFKKYSTDEELAKLEDAAREAERGDLAARPPPCDTVGLPRTGKAACSFNNKVARRRHAQACRSSGRNTNAIRRRRSNMGERLYPKGWH